MSETGDPALIGRRVAGKFVVEKFLGGGAMGAVYRAKDASLERLIALKVMHPAVAVDPSFVSRFHREARAASRLDHPSSMRVIEFGEEPDGLLYIAMEYLEGRDLYKVIHEDWPLPEPRIADIMMKALSALTMAHEMGVIHRDLKPENIMILDRKDDEGRDIVKVCDFGIAKITEKDEEAPSGPPRTAGAKLTTAGLVVGTPEYMSPEQARGEKLDARSDLYSMGIILYQLLTGRTPFLADTALAVVLKHISELPAPPSTIYAGVHKGLEAVCMRALEKSRDARWKSARDMRSAVRSAMEGRPMPVDADAATMADPLSAPALGVAQTQPLPALSSSSVPPLGVMQPTKSTPLGTAIAPPPESRSIMPYVVSVLALAAGGFVYMKFFATSPSAPPVTVATAAPPPVTTTSTTTTASATAPAPVTSAVTATASVSSLPLASPPPEVKGKRGAMSKPAEPASEPPPPPPAPEVTATQEPPPAPAPVPVAPPPPAPEVVKAFSPATCRATVGAHRSVSAYLAKDLTLPGTDAAWTACAKSSIKERPPAPIAGSVHLHFNDRTLRSATCAACPPALAACIERASKQTATFRNRSGDATGDPEFEVPVSFVCE